MSSSHSATRCGERLFHQHVTAGADRRVRRSRVCERGRRRDDDCVGRREQRVERVGDLRSSETRDRASASRLGSRSTTVTATSGVCASTRVCFEPQLPYPTTANSRGREPIAPFASAPFERSSLGSALVAPSPLLVVPTRVTPISLCVAPAQRDYRDGYGTWRIGCVQEAVRPDLHPDSDYTV